MDGDIELEIGSGSAQGNYTVRVIRAPAGGEPFARFSLDIAGVLNRRVELENAVLASAAAARRSIPATEQPLHEVGRGLFEALFTGPVNGAYRASLGAVQHSGHRLRVVLRFAAPELAALPWEMLFDPETDSYVCRARPLLRRIPAADYNPDPQEVVPPLRVLGVVASPRDLPRLDADAEKQHLAQALAGPIKEGLVELFWAPQATWEGVQTKLLAGPWHIVHFIGHGDYDVQRKEGRIALVTAGGRSDMVEASRLVDLLGEAEPTPRLVVLNSCSSGEAGEEDLFSGTAAALVGGGINAVAAMQFTVTDTAAIAFSRGFYAALAAGRDIDQAAGSGRRAIVGLGTLEWVTPVLYVRGGSTRLFSFTAPGRRDEPRDGSRGGPPAQEQEPRQDQEADLERELQDLYAAAHNALASKDYGTAMERLDLLLLRGPDFRDAAALRRTAGRRWELAGIYRAARAAETAEDWPEAARGYAQIQHDEDFSDAASRREFCERQQRITELQNKLRSLAHAGNWHAVLAVDQELRALNRSSANPDDLAVRARLEILYQQARTAEKAGDRGRALQLFSEILTASPHFRDAAARREALQSPPKSDPRKSTPPGSAGAAPEGGGQPKPPPEGTPRESAPRESIRRESPPRVPPPPRKAPGRTVPRPAPAAAAAAAKDRPVRSRYLRWGGTALIIAAVLPLLWTLSRADVVQDAALVFYRVAWLAAPVFFLLAGLPNRSVPGRLLLGAAAGVRAVALLDTLIWLESGRALIGGSSARTTVGIIGVACGLGAGILLVKSRTLAGGSRWLLLLLFLWQATSYLWGRQGPMTVGLPFVDSAVLLVIGALFVLQASGSAGPRRKPGPT